jgi:hypothetical protein
MSTGRRSTLAIWRSGRPLPGNGNTAHADSIQARCGLPMTHARNAQVQYAAA